MEIQGSNRSGIKILKYRNNSKMTNNRHLGTSAQRPGEDRASQNLVLGFKGLGVWGFRGLEVSGFGG